MTPSQFLRGAVLLAIVGCAGGSTDAATRERSYLYLWTASADSLQPDFLAVLDVTEDSSRYGRLVTTLTVPGLGNKPHHSEHEMPPDAQLFVNGFASGQTWIFDLKERTAPRIAGQFGDLAGYSHPHSFVRLPNGNILATFQMRHVDGKLLPGGLVEVTPAGNVVRSASADAPGVDANVRVYSAGVIPSLDRVVTTSTDMTGASPASRNIQLWRLSDLTLLHTFPLPEGPHSSMSAEPRVLGDGKTVLVSTFTCGLYLLDGLTGDALSARLVSSFPRKDGTYCAIPAIVGRYYLVTVPAWSAVVSLDISHPTAPK